MNNVTVYEQPSIWNDPSVMERYMEAAKMLADSNLVPEKYRGKPGDCLIAIDMANRTGLPAQAVLQSIDIIGGKPRWSGKACIAMIENSSRFERGSVRYVPVGEKGKDSWGGYYTAVYKGTNERVNGPVVTIGMAKAEGWYSKINSKSGEETSKWQTFPGKMLMYRAASFFADVYCASEMLGFRSEGEPEDIEANEAKINTPKQTFMLSTDNELVKCANCTEFIVATEGYPAEQIIKMTTDNHGVGLCFTCGKARKNKQVGVTTDDRTEENNEKA